MTYGFLWALQLNSQHIAQFGLLNVRFCLTNIGIKVGSFVAVALNSTEISGNTGIN